MTNIYILLLQNNKYYIGRTGNLDIRIHNHFNHSGSYWTLKYKPIKIIKTIRNCDLFDEDVYTLKMMAIHGIENVRGGSFSRITFSKEEAMMINKMINNANDRCFICYSKEHFCGKCPFEEISHYMLNLKNKILNVSKNFINRDNIKVDDIPLMLEHSDKIIFNDITNKNVIAICKKINQLEIKGVTLIDLNNYEINCQNFINGLVVFLDSKM